MQYRADEVRVAGWADPGNTSSGHAYSDVAAGSTWKTEDSQWDFIWLANGFWLVASVGT
jgi:hypothetical protein